MALCGKEGLTDSMHSHRWKVAVLASPICADFGVPADFIGQAIHSTSARNFRDTLNFAIRNDGTVRAFSVSNIGGAFGVR